MEGLGGWPLSRPWRLIVSEPQPGPWNMALDESLSETVRAGGEPFLRFYFWEPATLSLGRFQNLQTGFTDVVQTLPVVRRPTGGGGIWHADEITYSLGCLQSDLQTTGVKASFERLVGFLVDAWRSLGWDAGFAKDGANSTTLGAFTPACFAGQEEYDILVQGKKLGGNAQRRDRQSIFQHGSVPRLLDHVFLATLFQEGFRPDPATVTDLWSCGWKAPVNELIPTLSLAFADRLGVELHEASPTEAEVDRATALMTERFATASWTETGGGQLRLP